MNMNNCVMYRDGSTNARNLADVIYKQRVYISGPIAGVPLYELRFEEAERMLKAKGFDVVNPVAEKFNTFRYTKTGEPFNRYENLIFDFQLMTYCQVVYFLKGWEKAGGCMAEWAIAKERCMSCLFEEPINMRQVD